MRLSPLFGECSVLASQARVASFRAPQREKRQKYHRKKTDKDTIVRREMHILQKDLRHQSTICSPLVGTNLCRLVGCGEDGVGAAERLRVLCAVGKETKVRLADIVVVVNRRVNVRHAFVLCSQSEDVALVVGDLGYVEEE